MAHSLTCLHALRILSTAVGEDNRERLLQTYFMGFLLIYCAQGCPKIVSQSQELSTNSWDHVIKAAVSSSDAHISKVVYALKEAERVYSGEDWWLFIADGATSIIRDEEDWHFDP